MPKQTGVMEILKWLLFDRTTENCANGMLLGKEAAESKAESDILALVSKDDLWDFLRTYKELSCIDDCYLERIATAIHAEIVRRMKGDGR